MKTFILLLVMTLTPVALYLAGQPASYVFAAWAAATAAVFWFVSRRHRRPAEGVEPLPPLMRPQER